MRVQLHDTAVEIAGERGQLRRLIVRHRHDYLFGFEPLVPGCHDEPVSLPGKPIHFDSVLNWQVEILGVRFEILRYLLLGGERVSPRWKRHPWKSRVPRRREEPQRVPAVAPRVADPLTSVQNEEPNASFSQVVTNG